MTRSRLAMSFGLLLCVAAAVWLILKREPSQIIESPRQAVTKPSEVAPISPSSTPEPARRVEPSLANADVTARQQYYDGLMKAPALTLLHRFLEATKGPDSTTFSILQEAFITKLAESGSIRNDAATAEFIRVLMDPSYPVAIRLQLADALAESQSFSGVAAILQVAANSELRDDEMREGLNQAIAAIGGHRREDGTFPTDLSPLLETNFGRLSQTGGQEAGQFAATARALAQVGAESGIRALLLAIKRPDVNGSRAAVERAVQKIRNPAAIPALADPLRIPAAQTQLADPGLAVSGVALVHIGGEAAVLPLLEWLEQAPPEAQPLAALWFQNVREPVSAAVIESHLQTQTFRSEVIRETIRRQLNATAPEDL